MKNVGWSRLLVVVAVVLGMVGVVVPGAVAAPVPISAASDPTAEEQEALRQVAGAIWTPDLAAGWNMNTDVADVLSTATGEILRCSEAFALVPRPPGFLPGIVYLVTYALRLRDYFLVVRDSRTYRACVVTAAANYRTAIELASMGI
ncbi:hypothetical protein [Umezawaea tangerina]|uniref:Uncharacterized protein n=1 Tax=Umezawaea tangerina TaxID=84725 RepID=A0A2T0THH1_9PSEU|nr:hypothetical protein [Umezawaea tangerina]PRY45162.1 hypothetical protein CLV43_102727 [Umezawaea tangerina]